jgi:hypothetical protein
MNLYSRQLSILDGFRGGYVGGAVRGELASGRCIRVSISNLQPRHTMRTLSSIRTLAVVALITVGTALMGCGSTLTGPDAPSSQEIDQPQQPTMSTSGDAEENDPI